MGEQAGGVEGHGPLGRVRIKGKIDRRQKRRVDGVRNNV